MNLNIQNFYVEENKNYTFPQVDYRNPRVCDRCFCLVDEYHDCVKNIGQQVINCSRFIKQINPLLSEIISAQNNIKNYNNNQKDEISKLITQAFTNYQNQLREQGSVTNVDDVNTKLKELEKNTRELFDLMKRIYQTNNISFQEQLNSLELNSSFRSSNSGIVSNNEEMPQYPFKKKLIIYEDKFKAIADCNNWVDDIIVLQDKSIASVANDVKIWKKVGDKYNIIQTLESEPMHSDTSIIQSVDGNLFVSSKSGRVRIYKKDESNQYKQVNSFACHNLQICTLLLLRNKYISTGSEDRTIRIWEMNAEGAREKQTLEGHTSSVYAITELKNGYLVTGSLDKTTIVWRKPNQKYEKFQILKEHKGTVNCVIEVKDDEFATGSNDKTIIFWKLNNEKSSYSMQYQIEAEFGYVNCMILKKNGDIVAGVGGGRNPNYRIQVFREKEGKYQPHSVAKGHNNVIEEIVMLDDEKFISCSRDKRIILWDLPKD